MSILIMAAGVLVISLAGAAGRSGSTSVAWVASYWLGEAVMFAPVVWQALSRSGPGESEAAGLVTGLALATYLVKFIYSPAHFAFPDELQHWRTTVNLLNSHHLFGVNYALPVSPVYPGLEETTGALVTVTGLPVFAAGLIVAGLSHLLLAVALYVLFRQVSGSARIAVVACMIYATNPHYQVFDAIYGYQTLALAFFGLALVAVLRLVGRAEPAGRARWWVIAVALVGATTVTHHVTSYMLAGTLALLAAVGGARRYLMRRRDSAGQRPGMNRYPGGDSYLGEGHDPGAKRYFGESHNPGEDRSTRGNRRTGAARFALLAEISAAFIVVWLRWVAPATISYLTPTLHNFTSGLLTAFAAHASSHDATPAGPVADRLANYAAAAVIVVGVPFGWRYIRRTWRTCQYRTWTLALAAGAVGYYLIAALRVTTPNGAELAGRSMTFLYIPVSYTLALALAGFAGADLRWRRRVTRMHAPAALAMAAAAVLVVGGLAAGWPPYWERLPGHYVVDGFESGITPEGVATATWARTALGPAHRIAADFTNYILLGSYGDQNVVNAVDQLYCTPRWTTADAALASQQSVQYLVVDLRMTDHKAAPEGYFPTSSGICPSPIPLRDLTKFNAVPGSDRVYDSGNIIIYRLTGG